MYKELNRYDTFEDAIQATYGRTLDQLSEEFQLAMRRDFYPSVDSLAPLAVLGREITRLAIKPAFLPDTGGGDVPGRGAYRLAGHRLCHDLPQAAGRRAKPARSWPAAASADLESFHPFDSRMDASRPGFLLFAARYGDRDALVVWDLKRGKIAGRYQFPSWSRSSPRCGCRTDRASCFSGLSESGVSDLYRVRLPDGTLEPLTRDRFQDLDPSPQPDGRRLVFASDRTAGGLDGAVNLFLLDLDSAQISQLTPGDWVDEAPVVGTGRPDLLHLEPRRRAQCLLGGHAGGGASRDLGLERRLRRRPLPDGSGLLVGGFHDLSWNLYRYPVDSAARQQRFSIDSALRRRQWSWGTPRRHRRSGRGAASPIGGA